MTLEALYYWSQIIAVVAIVATLVAILVQAHQTNKIARAELTLSMWMQTGAMYWSLYDNPEKADFMQRALNGSAPLTDAEKSRFTSALGIAVGTAEAAFMLRKRGLVEAAAYERNLNTLRIYLQSPRVRKWWRNIRSSSFDAAFRDVVDGFATTIDAAATKQGTQL